MPHLPHKSDSLQPPETLFDPFSFLLTDRVAVMPRGPGVDRASAAALRVLRYMRRDLQMPALGHEIPRVVTFVGTYRDLMLARNLLQHSHRRGSLCQTIGGKHFRVHYQFIAVLRRQVPVVTPLGFLSAALGGQSRICLGCGLGSLVAPVLSVKVHSRVARIVRRLGISVLPLEALQTRPRFDQRAIHSEMLITG